MFIRSMLYNLHFAKIRVNMKPDFFYDYDVLKTSSLLLNVVKKFIKIFGVTGISIWRV